jgi:predicted unusual protein kinase regulating ubiquinone biosynthesis (AarF/ABC1/UbiB family)
MKTARASVWWSSLRRLVHVGAVLARHALAYLIGARLERWPRVAQRLPSGRLSGPDRLRTLFEDLGGTFVKFGQMLALQPDVLSLEYCNALFNLLDRVAPCAYEDVARLFVEETGRAPDVIFDSFDREPLATASIGQVHVARLDGRKLAVKVHRPNVDHEFAGDIRLMSALLGVIKKLHLGFLYWMIEPLEEFVAWTREELDYRSEARYLDQMRRNAADSPHERIPEVLLEHTTPRILVTEFLEGVTVLDHLRSLEAGDEVMSRRLRSGAFDPDRFARHIIDNFLSDAYRHGLFHADLHPANLMILPQNVVGYIDFGITGVLSRFSRQNLVALTLAYTRGDLEGMAGAFLRGAALGANADETAFREGLSALSSSWYETGGQERRVRKSFTLVMLDMLRLSRQTDVWPERDVIKYIRSAIAIDGLIKRFAPGFNVARHLEAVCDRYLRWEMRRALLSYDSLINWSNASTALVRDGVFRAARVIQRFAEGDWPGSGQGQRRGAARQRRFTGRAAFLSALVGGVAVLLSAPGPAAQSGAGLLAVEALSLAAAAALLLRTMRRLA